jgi:hypothetical protein
LDVSLGKIKAGCALVKPPRPEPIETRANKKRSIKGKQLNAGWNHACFFNLLGVQI